MATGFWRGRSRVLLVSVCCFNPFGLIALVPVFAAAAPTTTGTCGAIDPAHNVIEPPAVDMWKAPMDASGVHELILTVHRDGQRFCYIYRWHGVDHTVAPAVHVRRGQSFAIRLVNEISGPSLGESVPSTAISPCKPMLMPTVPIEHWVGYLNRTVDDRFFRVNPLDTNLHLHGFEGPASEEDIFLSTLSTPMHACEYRITIPHTQPPGTYVYHPHAHGASDAEISGGLVGAWIVDPDTPQLPRADQHVVLLTYRQPISLYTPVAKVASMRTYFDTAAAHEAARKQAQPVHYDPFDPPPWPTSYPISAGGIRLDPAGCNGGPLDGDPIISVDGTDTPASLSIPAGRTQLLRIINGTADSPILLRLRSAQGHPVPFRVVERDGVPVSGNMQHPYARYVLTRALLLSVMSRAEILLTAKPGEHFVLSSEPFCDGPLNPVQAHHDLLRITATNAPAGEESSLHSMAMDIADTPAAKLLAWVRAHPSRVHRRAITFTVYAFPRQGKVPHHFAYYITDTTKPDFHEHPFWPVFRPSATVPSNPDIVVKQGTIEVWYLINATMATHDFHIHQMAFVQERDYSGQPITVDTASMPVGKLLPNPRDPDYPLIQPSVTKVILDFRHVPRGTFVFHCHMLRHEDGGMMGIIRVE